MTRECGALFTPSHPQLPWPSKNHLDDPALECSAGQDLARFDPHAHRHRNADRPLRPGYAPQTHEAAAPQPRSTAQERLGMFAGRQPQPGIGLADRYVDAGSALDGAELALNELAHRFGRHLRTRRCRRQRTDADRPKDGEEQSHDRKLKTRALLRWRKKVCATRTYRWIDVAPRRNNRRQ